ncbi:GGDEF domain-containing protein [Betaproteobacteria bacterium]|nr:GGDEF domain-containing protein [Betaproteobacteria bacterium]
MTSNDASELLLEYGNEILILVDLETQKIRATNGAAARYLGYDRDHLIGRPITDILSDLTDIFYWEDVKQGIVLDVLNAETQYLCASGELLSVSKSIIRLASHPDLLVVCAILTSGFRRTENELAHMVARLRATLEATADGILLLDKNGAILNMNRQFAHIWRIPDDPLLASDEHAVFEFLASSMRDPKAYKARLAEIYSNSDDETRDLLTLGDGRFIERKSRPAKMGKQTIGRVLSFTDITEEKAMESQLRLAASVFSHAHQGILITDAAGNIINVNASYCQITGYAREELIGQNPRILKSGRHSDNFYQMMWNDLITQGHWEGEIWNRLKNGELFAERLSITTVEDVASASLNYVAIISDITELKEYEQRLERMAHYDALTDLPNRVLLADRLNMAIAQARRYKRCLALVCLDIDGFKKVNDIHGRDAGDLLLITIARKLRGALRDSDTLARLGGDEFALMITDLEGCAECEHVVARFLRVIATPFEIEQKTLQLSASMGVTLFPADDADADTLLRHANYAMYQAKQSGKNRYYLFDAEKAQKVQEHQKQLSRILQAFERNEFELYFQPKVNMRTGIVFGAEALIRWQKPGCGLVSPGEFLPLIEGSDLMVLLDNWVMDTALAQMTAWHDSGLNLVISVNVSAPHLQQADFLPNLKKKLDSHPRIRPDCFEIEVLETIAIKGIARISSLIESCQDIGVRFSLDDFGTGYSSLTYLRHLPANILKIDQSFVRGMLQNSGDKAIVEGIIGLAAAFRRTVIAEGVETVKHGELLLRLGCELAQGYGIAKPMPAGELPAWIATWHTPLEWIG